MRRSSWNLSRREGDLAHAGAELKRGKEVVLAAVTKHEEALRYADAQLKRDKEVVVAVVTRHWWRKMVALRQMPCPAC